MRLPRAGEADIAVNICVLPEFFTVASPAMDQDSALRDFLISTLCHDAAGVNYIHFQVAGVLPIQNLMENMIWSQVDQAGAKPQDRAKPPWRC